MAGQMLYMVLRFVAGSANCFISFVFSVYFACISLSFYLFSYEQDMWNVTPVPELLGALPQEYSLETALADLLVNTALYALKLYISNFSTMLFSVHFIC
jgi:hypothetical protein